MFTIKFRRRASTAAAWKESFAPLAIEARATQYAMYRCSLRQSAWWVSSGSTCHSTCGKGGRCGEHLHAVGVVGELRIEMRSRCDRDATPPCIRPRRGERTRRAARARGRWYLVHQRRRRSGSLRDHRRQGSCDRYSASCAGRSGLPAVTGNSSPHAARACRLATRRRRRLATRRRRASRSRGRGEHAAGASVGKEQAPW